MQIVSVGIDLGKTTFHLVALGVAGEVDLGLSYDPSGGVQNTVADTVASRCLDGLVWTKRTRA